MRRSKTYSSGMHVRLGFAIAIHSNPALLLIDEVLAVGDSAFQDKCIEKVLGRDKAPRSSSCLTRFRPWNDCVCRVFS